MSRPTRPPKVRLWPAYLSGGFGLSASTMLGLLVPLRADELGIPIATIGVIVGAQTAVSALLVVPISRVIRRLGTRRAFLVSTAGCTVLASAFTLADELGSLLVLNAAVGAVSALGWVSSQTYISSLGGPEQRARNAGRFSFVTNISLVVTPVMVGAAAAVIGYRASFLVVAAYFLLFVIVGMALPRPTARATGEPIRLRAAGRLFRLPAMQVAMLLTFVRIAVAQIWNPFVPLLLVAGGFSAQLAGAVLSFAAVVATAVSLLTGRLARYASPQVLCTIALGLAVAGLAVTPHLLSVPAVFLPAALVGIGSGMSLPLLIVIVSDGAPAGQRALALGTRNAVNSAAATLSPLGTAPMIAALGAAAGFGLAGGLAASVLGAAVLIQARIRRDARSVEASGPAAGN